MINTEHYYNKVLVSDVLEGLNSLPDDVIDLSITSPPYNKKRSRGWLVKNHGYSHYEDLMLEKDYQVWQIKVLDALFRVVKPGGSLFYNHKIRWSEGEMLHPLSWITGSKWSIRQEIIWDRGLAANMRGWRYWQVDERIYWLYKPINKNLIGAELASKHAKLSSIWRMTPANRISEHPAPFPIDLPTRIIYSIADSSRQFILDPFCGTGTTLVAAKILGHDFLGFDISPDYVSYSMKRLENHQQEEAQLKREIDKHTILDPFKARKKRGTVSWPFGPKKNDLDSDTDS